MADENLCVDSNSFICLFYERTKNERKIDAADFSF